MKIMKIEDFSETKICSTPVFSLLDCWNHFEILQNDFPKSGDELLQKISPKKYFFSVDFFFRKKSQIFFWDFFLDFHFQKKMLKFSRINIFDFSKMLIFFRNCSKIFFENNFRSEKNIFFQWDFFLSSSPNSGESI